MEHPGANSDEQEQDVENKVSKKERKKILFSHAQHIAHALSFSNSQIQIFSYELFEGTVTRGRFGPFVLTCMNRSRPK